MPSANATSVRDVLLAVQAKIIDKSASICSGTSFSFTEDNTRIVDADKFVQGGPECYVQICKMTESYPGARSRLNNLRFAVRVALFRRQVSDDFGSLDKAIAGPAASGIVIMLDRVGQYLDQSFLTGLSPSLNLLLPLRLEAASVIDGATADTGFGFFRGYRDFTCDIERVIEEFE